MKLKGLKYFLFIVVIAELVIRIWISVTFQTSFFKPDLLKDKFYPELNFVLEDNAKATVLVLGGSVVSESDMTVNYEGQQKAVKFCHISDKFPKDNYQVVSLAQPGHNSLDSWYKYNYLKAYKFDYVFVYHGINDVRANNWPGESFEADYGHIEFYDDLSVVIKHKELSYVTSFFAVEWMIHLFNKRDKQYLPKELFAGLLYGEAEWFLTSGSEIKTGESFKANINSIVEMGATKNEKIILSTYAWYLPDNYSYEAFIAQELDYDQQLFPTELYGIPSNVEKGLLLHNDILLDLEYEHPHVAFFNLQNEIPHNRNYFNDVCHLNEQGCELLSNLLLEQVEAN